MAVGKGVSASRYQALPTKAKRRMERLFLTAKNNTGSSTVDCVLFWFRGGALDDEVVVYAEGAGG
jgi:hypothetical protein